MKFKHPVNGHEVERKNVSILTFLFGPLYFLSLEIYNQAIIMANVTSIFIIALFFMYPQKTWPIVMVIIVINLAFAMVSEAIIEAHYLRHGWTKIRSSAVM